MAASMLQTRVWSSSIRCALIESDGLPADRGRGVRLRRARADGAAEEVYWRTGGDGDGAREHDLEDHAGKVPVVVNQDVVAVPAVGVAVEAVEVLDGTWRPRRDGEETVAARPPGGR